MGTKYLRQGTAAVINFGPCVDAGDGVAPETGLVSALDHASTGIMLSKNGGALTIRHATVTATTHDARGNYRVTLDTTDTDTCGALRAEYADAAVLCPVWEEFVVLPAQVYDSLILGTDLLDANTAQWLGTACATPTTAGVPEVDTTHVSGTAQTAGDICGRIPAALVGGRMDASVGAVAAGAITAAGFAAGALDAVWSTAARTLTAATNLTTDIAAAVWDRLTSAITTAGSIGKLIVDYLDATISSREASGAAAAASSQGEAAAASSQGEAEAAFTARTTDGAGTEFLAPLLALAPTGGAAPTVEQIVDGVWDESRANHVTPGTFGMDGAATRELDTGLMLYGGAIGATPSVSLLMATTTITSRMYFHAESSRLWDEGGYLGYWSLADGWVPEAGAIPSYAAALTVRSYNDLGGGNWVRGATNAPVSLRFSPDDAGNSAVDIFFGTGFSGGQVRGDGLGFLKLNGAGLHEQDTPGEMISSSPFTSIPASTVDQMVAAGIATESVPGAIEAAAGAGGGGTGAPEAGFFTEEA